MKYQVNFTQPISLGLEYAAVANTADLINDKGEYIITCPINQTITVDNPDDQLLIDTNYDGFFESGVTRFSSFEIRFRLNSAVPLAAGSGTFKFQTYLTTSLAIQHKNLVDDAPNRATFRFYAVCVPKDSDADGVADALDIDSDNDGILDVVESQGPTFVALSGNDANDDGLDDIFGPAYVPNDFDGDGVPNYLDLDSDNDGIYDLTEAQSGALDANLDGIIDAIQVGTNGLHNGLENAVDSGTLNYTLADSDGDGIFNYVALDADNDLCADVIEAGFADSDANGVLGAGSVTVNANGVVTGAGGYTPPNPNYSISAPISITTAPQDVTVCELQNAVFTVVPATPVDSYQWQVSTDNGTTWTTLTNGPNYTGVTSNTLTALAVTPAMVGYRYRVVLNRNGNSCGLNSQSAVLTTYALPVVTTPLTLVQCDNDTDGISSFNLTQKNNQISANAANETFTYFTSQTAAQTNDVTQQITGITAYTTTNTTVWVRVENANQCFRVARLNLIVSATQIPAGTSWQFTQCDFYVSPQDTDTDGIATFNFSSVSGQIQALLPNTATYTISYYRNEADALAENDSNGNSLAITNPANYANIGYPNTQQIWVRVDSNVDNACFGLGPYITLTVQALPTIFPLGNGNVIRACDDDQDGSFAFNTSTLQSSLLQGQTGVVVEYLAGNGTPIPAPFPPTYTVTGTETIQVRVANANSIPVDGPCFRTTTVTFIVDDLPELFAVAPNRFEVCDDETDPALQNGTVAFDTTTLTQDLLQGQTGFTLTYTWPTVQFTPINSQIRLSVETQTVLVTLTNPINTNCSATYPLSFVVHPRPWSTSMPKAGMIP